MGSYTPLTPLTKTCAKYLFPFVNRVAVFNTNLNYLLILVLVLNVCLVTIRAFQGNSLTWKVLS